MQCFVYKGDNKDDHYLYLSEELTDEVLERLPKALLTLLGQLHPVVDFELSADKQLAQAEAPQVMADIQEQGFYLQMPKKDMALEEHQYFN